jgi:hydroxymethylglutaryl-CoA lyase
MDKVTITDVTLREYGQNVPENRMNTFSPEIRVEIALRLIDAGFSNIELFSCINPKVAPAMHRKALERIAVDLGRIDGVNLITLVPNKAGYRNFLDLDLGPGGFNHTIGIFFSAVEAHNLANLGRPIRETVKEYQNIASDARSNNIRMVGYISAAFGYFDPDQGVLLQAEMSEINHYLDLLFDMGAETVTFSDLQGVADRNQTGRFFETILDMRKGKDREKLGYHPHHISGDAAIGNSRIAYDLGVRRFDSSLGGTGGCVTGAPGNQPTEELVRFFYESGIESGIDEQKVFSLTEMVQRELYDT